MALVPLVIKDGNNASQSQEMFQGGVGLGNNIPVVSLDSTRHSYRAGAQRAAVITTTTKTLVTVTGSATKTVRISKFLAYFEAATPAASVVFLQRVSAIGSGGTVVSPTVAKLDTAAPTASAVVSHYTTGAQSQGTAVGGPMAIQGTVQAVTTTAPTFFGLPMQWLFPESGVLAGQAIVLRGVADILELSNYAAIGTTPVLSYIVEWQEDAS